MKSHAIAVLSLFIFGTAVPSCLSAEVEKDPSDWQKLSLKGVQSVSYGVAYDPTTELSKIVAKSMSAIKVPTKSVDIKASNDQLTSDEAKVKVYIDKRGKLNSWVGLSVQQKSALVRTPSVTFDASTYTVGKLVPAAQKNSALKEICDKFAADFNAQNSK